MCVGAYKGKTEEEPRAEVRRTFWKFEWDSKPPGQESWYLQSEEREKCPGIGSMLTSVESRSLPSSWQDLHGREALSAPAGGRTDGRGMATSPVLQGLF